MKNLSQEKSRYVHFTSSAVLVFLPHTDFALISIQEMLRRGFAPLSGEIFCGGCKSVTGNRAATAFAKVGDSYWHFDDLHRRYGRHEWRSRLIDPVSVTEAIEKMCSMNLSGIDEVLVDFLRHRQMQKFPELEAEKITDLSQKVTEKLTFVKKRYVLNYLVGRYVREIKESSMSEMSEIETLDCFYKRLVNNMPVDMMQQTSAQQLQFLNSQEPPTDIIVLQDTLSQQLQEVASIDLINLRYELAQALSEPTRNSYIDNVTCLNFKWKSEKEIVADIEYLMECISKAIIDVTEKCRLLHGLLRGEGNYMDLTQSRFINEPFPIALITTNADKLSKVKYEFRATEALTIGSDIGLILTDDDHLGELKAFLQQHDLVQDVQVQTFAQFNQNRSRSQGEKMTLFKGAQAKSVVSKSSGATSTNKF